MDRKEDVLMERGAEAVIYRKGKAVIKRRTRKAYRHPEIDSYIRKFRTRREAKAISDARRNGVPTPVLLDLSRFEIKLEFLEGEKVRDIYEELSDERYREIGRQVGKLHEAGIVHGDLTTSNLILSRGLIHLIDFGLSAYEVHTEPRGVDLHVLFQTIRSSHGSAGDSIPVIKNGYRRAFDDCDEVLEKIEEIEERGRYV